jgi:hypothetical protein
MSNYKCAANGSEGCRFGPHGPKGEQQCEWCGQPPEPAPIDMVLHCPQCHTQHIDAPEYPTAAFPEQWTNPPHRSHRCQACNHIWRPADVPTNGVAAVKTKGKDDSPPPTSTGREDLWCWFGLSYASFLVAPRILMHAMPDAWQAKMAALLREFDAAWDTGDICEGVTVRAVGKRGRLTKFPAWLLNYRHPDKSKIDTVRAKP